MKCPRVLGKTTICQTPAKVTLFLQVTGRRPDGYHDLVSLMCPVRLYDTLRLAFETPHLRVFCDHPEVPGNETNLALQAAAAFEKATGICSGLQVHIEKQIPVAAGLGGGSSNAGAVLRELNRYFGEPLTEERLMQIGAAIGADVPFFITPQPVIATGIGDKLEKFKGLEAWPVVLVRPRFNVSTAEIYRNLNLGLTLCKSKDIYIRFKSNKIDIQTDLCNDLETVAIEKYPEIGVVKRVLAAAGAEGVLMSGSGPTVFGLFADRDRAQGAFRCISGENRWQTFLTDLAV